MTEFKSTKVKAGLFAYRELLAETTPYSLFVTDDGDILEKFDNGVFVDPDSSSVEITE